MENNAIHVYQQLSKDNPLIQLSEYSRIARTDAMTFGNGMQ